MVAEEIQTLHADRAGARTDGVFRMEEEVPGRAASEVDPFDMVQLALVIETCRSSASLSAAGRRLFAKSRARRKTQNDGDRLRKYLLKFGLEWEALARG